jgi:hypothetical protein
MKTKTAVLFGAGVQGKIFYEKFKNIYNILWATDNDEKKYGKELLSGLIIKDKRALLDGGFDYVIITTYAGFEEVNRQLIEEFGIDENRIISKHVEHVIAAKKQFLVSFAKIVYTKNIPGDVCEVGVYRGGFAKEINRNFPDRKLYLFDTFQGYDQRDIEVEYEKNYNMYKIGDLGMTSEELVLQIMPHREKCVIKKGYFPETFDLPLNKFCFVNIDLDLYKPCKAALELFYPRMSQGGIILIHDYFFSYTGAREAIDEFITEHKIGIAPIGDAISVCIVKD